VEPNLNFSAPSVGKTVVAASSPAELAEFITFSSLALPEYTMALAYEAEHVFTNLLMLSDHEQQIPVVVKLGHDCMQIASVSRSESLPDLIANVRYQWRKQDLTGNVKSYIIDVIQLKDIDDILASGGLPGDHLIVKHSQNEAITFISKSECDSNKPILVLMSLDRTK
jgi:neurofibromin 1